MRRTLAFTLSAGMALVLAGCGISQGTRNFAEQTERQIERRAQEIESARQELTAFLESPESEGLREAAEREQWVGRLDVAAQKVETSRKTYDEKVRPILEADDSSREYELYEPLESIGQILESTRENTEFWRVRRDAMMQVKANAGQVREQARAAVESIETQLQRIRPQSVQAKREFEDQAEAIDALVDPLEERLTAAREALGVVEEQYRTHQQGSGGDYGAMLGAAQVIETNHAYVAQAANEAEAKFSQLSQSYARTLIDMNAEYFLTIRRQSWDNSRDYPALHNYDYPERQVDAETLRHFDEIRTSLATYKRGWFSNDLDLFRGVDAQRWNALQIDPEENWPSKDDDEAELWLQNTRAQYFHKYHVVENGETYETDWVPVEEAFFFANIDNLGMDVEAKPYGAFESEKMTNAAPPGMAYVGNERYGRWERRNGGTVWTWIAPYLFYRSLFGNPWQYNRSEWNTWRSGYYGSRPYYGGTASSPRYGTRSSRTQSSPVLSGSRFGRSGGFSRPAGSVRGAGPAGRGGGFGGSGK